VEKAHKIESKQGRIKERINEILVAMRLKRRVKQATIARKIESAQTKQGKR